MKMSKKFLIAGAALCLACGMTVLAACGGGVSGEKVTFEAEKAQLSQNADGVAVYQSATEYSATGEGDLVELVGYFTAEGANIVWKINADKECDAELTLRAASASADGSGLWQGGHGFIKEMDLGSGKFVKLEVNGKAASLSGKLPGLEFTPAEDFSNFGDFYGSCMNNYGTAKAKIHLVAGENTITLTSLGYVETPEGEGAQPISYGINVDNIVIQAPATLTWTETDNSGRTAPQFG